MIIFLKTFSHKISLFIYPNLIQLTSSTLLEKIKVSAGQLGLGNDTFSSICGAFFSGKSRYQFNLGHVIFVKHVDLATNSIAYYYAGF